MRFNIHSFSQSLASNILFFTKLGVGLGFVFFLGASAHAQENEAVLSEQRAIGQGCYQFNNSAGPVYSCIDKLSFNRSVLNRRSGYCEILFDIDRFGYVNNVFVLNNEPSAAKFAGACRTAPRRWRFTPPKTENKHAAEIKNAMQSLPLAPTRVNLRCHGSSPVRPAPSWN